MTYFIPDFGRVLITTETGEYYAKPMAAAPTGAKIGVVTNVFEVAHRREGRKERVIHAFQDAVAEAVGENLPEEQVMPAVKARIQQVIREYEALPYAVRAADFPERELEPLHPMVGSGYDDAPFQRWARRLAAA